MRLLLLAALTAVLGCGDPAPVTSAPAFPDASAETGDPALQPREGEVDCRDFDTHEQAQRFFDSRPGRDRDYYGLDPDGDGIACEELL